MASEILQLDITTIPGPLVKSIDAFFSSRPKLIFPCKLAAECELLPEEAFDEPERRGYVCITAESLEKLKEEEFASPLQEIDTQKVRDQELEAAFVLPEMLKSPAEVRDDPENHEFLALSNMFRVLFPRYKIGLSLKEQANSAPEINILRLQLRRAYCLLEAIGRVSKEVRGREISHSNTCHHIKKILQLRDFTALTPYLANPEGFIAAASANALVEDRREKRQTLQSHIEFLLSSSLRQIVDTRVLPHTIIILENGSGSDGQEVRFTQQRAQEVLDYLENNARKSPVSGRHAVKEPHNTWILANNNVLTRVLKAIDPPLTVSCILLLMAASILGLFWAIWKMLSPISGGDDLGIVAKSVITVMPLFAIFAAAVTSDNKETKDYNERIVKFAELMFGLWLVWVSGTLYTQAQSIKDVNTIVINAQKDFIFLGDKIEKALKESTKASQASQEVTEKLNKLMEEQKGQGHPTPTD